MSSNYEIDENIGDIFHIGLIGKVINTLYCFPQIPTPKRTNIPNMKVNIRTKFATNLKAAKVPTANTLVSI